MLPVVAGVKQTKIHILAYTLLLIPIVMLPYFVGMSGHIYAATATMLAIKFLDHAIKVYKSDRETAPKAMFKFSILFLFMIFVSLIADRIMIDLNIW